MPLSRSCLSLHDEVETTEYERGDKLVPAKFSEKETPGQFWGETAVKDQEALFKSILLTLNLYLIKCGDALANWLFTRN